MLGKIQQFIENRADEIGKKLDTPLPGTVKDILRTEYTTWNKMAGNRLWDKQQLMLIRNAIVNEAIITRDYSNIKIVVFIDQVVDNCNKNL